ncbi:MAG TPA: terminase family protein [Mycobacterium sp.]|nr:terminase family protein [Mycobacterium sp.]
MIDCIKVADGPVIFKPWDGPQLKFWTSRSRYALAAGAGFTGKSDMLRWYPFQQIAEDNERIERNEIELSTGHALYLRREMPMLREVMNRCKKDFKKVIPDADKYWKATDKTYEFPNGYRYTFGHMENEEDFDKYQGWQLSIILWDELCTFTEKQFDMMDTWLRPAAGSKLTPMMRAGANPIGTGRKWVKERFKIVKGQRVTEFEKSAEVEIEDEGGNRRKVTEKRSFSYFHILVTDNKSVDQAAYLASFAGKPENVVRALRDGDFDAATGDLVGQAWDETVHIVKAFAIPSTRLKFRSCHFSYAATMVLWWAVDFDGNLTCYRELPLKNHTASMVAERIREVEIYEKEWFDDEERGSKLTGAMGPAAAWAKTGQRGPSPAETMRRAGIYFSPADENLEAAADQIRDRLIRRTKATKDSAGIPGVRFFKHCAASLEAIPSMTADKTNPDVPDPKQEASAYRALCYACMSRPIAPERAKPRDDDWDSWEKPKTTLKSKTGMRGMW